MQTLISLNLLTEEETCLWIAKILRIVSKFRIRKGQFDAETERCIKFAETTSNAYYSAECIYSTSLFLLNYDTGRAYELIQKAYTYISEAIKSDNGAHTLILHNEILILQIYFAEVFKQNAEPYRKERVETLARLNLISADYKSVRDEIEVLRKEEKSEIKTKKLKENKKLRKELSREQVSAEEKAVNKILLLIVVGVVSVFAIAMPIFFSTMRSSAMEIFQFNSAYYLFIGFYVAAAFETFFNMTVCFAVYGLLQILHPVSDYKKRVIWTKRTIVFAVLSAVILLIYSIVWDYNYDTYILDYSFVEFEIYGVLILASEFLLIMMTLNEAMSFFANERPVVSKLDNHERFVKNYVSNMINAVIKITVLALTTVTFWQCKTTQLTKNPQIFDDALLIFSDTLFYTFSGVIAFIIISKVLFLTIMYARRKYGKSISY